MPTRIDAGTYRQAKVKLVEASGLLEGLAVACLKNSGSSEAATLLYGIIDSIRGLHSEIDEVEPDFNDALSSKPIRSMTARRFQARSLRNLDAVSRRVVGQTRRMARIEKVRNKEISRLKV
jgi:hypothetical protein